MTDHVRTREGATQQQQSTGDTGERDGLLRTRGRQLAGARVLDRRRGLLHRRLHDRVGSRLHRLVDLVGRLLTLRRHGARLVGEGVLPHRQTVDDGVGVVLARGLGDHVLERHKHRHGLELGAVLLVLHVVGTVLHLDDRDEVGDAGLGVGVALPGLGRAEPGNDHPVLVDGAHVEVGHVGGRELLGGGLARLVGRVELPHGLAVDDRVLVALTGRGHDEAVVGGEHHRVTDAAVVERRHRSDLLDAVLGRAELDLVVRDPAHVDDGGGRELRVLVARGRRLTAVLARRPAVGRVGSLPRQDLVQLARLVRVAGTRELGRRHDRAVERRVDVVLVAAVELRRVGRVGADLVDRHLVVPEQRLRPRGLVRRLLDRLVVGVGRRGQVQRLAEDVALLATRDRQHHLARCRVEGVAVVRVVQTRLRRSHVAGRGRIRALRRELRLDGVRDLEGVGAVGEQVTRVGLGHADVATRLGHLLPQPGRVDDVEQDHAGGGTGSGLRRRGRRGVLGGRRLLTAGDLTLPVVVRTTDLGPDHLVEGPARPLGVLGVLERLGAVPGTRVVVEVEGDLASTITQVDDPDVDVVGLARRDVRRVVHGQRRTRRVVVAPVPVEAPVPARGHGGLGGDDEHHQQGQDGRDGHPSPRGVRAHRGARMRRVLGHWPTSLSSVMNMNGMHCFVCELSCRSTRARSSKSSTHERIYFTIKSIKSKYILKVERCYLVLFLTFKQ